MDTNDDANGRKWPRAKNWHPEDSVEDDEGSV